MQAFPLSTIDFATIIKVFVVFGLALYVIFALVVVRQVQLMTDTLEVGFESQVRLLALIHLIFAVGVLLLAIFVL